MTKGFSLGQWFGIKVVGHWTLLALLAISLLSSFLQGNFYPVIFITTALFFVLLHEFGHSIVANKLGIPVDEIIMTPIGGLAKMTKLASPTKEFWITVAGPAVNFVIGTIGMILSLVLGSVLPQILNTALAVVVIINLFIGIFNLIPAFPMDGGRILRSVLCHWFSYFQATKIAVKTSQFLCIFFVVLGILWGSFNLPIIGVLLFMAAAAELKSVEMRDIIHKSVLKMEQNGVKMTPHHRFIKEKTGFSD